MVCHSIFNDVLGPVMAGPSSSHSAGCARIGKLTQILCGKEIKKAVVVYDSQGSYPSLVWARDLISDLPADFWDLLMGIRG